MIKSNVHHLTTWRTPIIHESRRRAPARLHKESHRAQPQQPRNRTTYIRSEPHTAYIYRRGESISAFGIGHFHCIRFDENYIIIVIGLWVARELTSSLVVASIWCRWLYIYIYEPTIYVYDDGHTCSYSCIGGVCSNGYSHLTFHEAQVRCATRRALYSFT